MSACGGRHCVYRMYDADGVLLYVGATSDLGRRAAQHQAGREWFDDVVRFEVEHYPDARAALDRETELVNTAHPRHQVTFTGRSNNGWEGRRARQSAAHDAGERCNEYRCVTCGGRNGTHNEQGSPTPDYLGSSDVARQLGVNPSTVYRWTTSGKLTPIPVTGGLLLFTQDEVDRFVREARV